jgi:hypothetical protein
MGKRAVSTASSDENGSQAKDRMKPTPARDCRVETSSEAAQLNRKNGLSHSNTMSASDGEISDNYDEVPRDLSAQVRCLASDFLLVVSRSLVVTGL